MMYASASLSPLWPSSAKSMTLNSELTVTSLAGMVSVLPSIVPAVVVKPLKV